MRAAKTGRQRTRRRRRAPRASAATGGARWTAAGESVEGPALRALRSALCARRTERLRQGAGRGHHIGQRPAITDHRSPICGERFAMSGLQ
ncbi:hypothetical protein CWD88_33625 [Burkholderia pseudomallei]|uniref:Uncharacterized protein n=1 Tax=Burkholderia pseudomallei TaxID=28450 RepID=A0AAX0U0I5_BURPE|nr:hypothetical protein BHT10_01320 [Burkholderia pseudomallei]MUU82986.1 hypothetical protein [Burkholderia pseudomallei]PJO62003.1 hypothetical protein CWD88_33625 [Burkholderia pseudomallei]PNW90982.1 hypothetical protein CF640_27815 [Burkholderia pseudomallei]PNX17810.1 hypothetical protein CF645_31825 [Burkholderia pseudomallei]